MTEFMSPLSVAGHPVELSSSGWYGPGKFLVELTHGDTELPDAAVMEKLVERHLPGTYWEVRRLPGFLAFTTRREPTKEEFNAFHGVVAARIALAV